MVRTSSLRTVIWSFVLGGLILNVVLVLVAFTKEWLFVDEAIKHLSPVLETFAPVLALIAATLLGNQGASSPELEKEVPQRTFVVVVCLCLFWVVMVIFPWAAALWTGADRFVELAELWDRFIGPLADVTILVVVGYFFRLYPPARAGGIETPAAE